jgi:glycosyltransferase involved in cell wall biosynthesis
MAEPTNFERSRAAQRRNVLVIAYYFPPMGLSGVQRTLKFVKYLPQFGWQPTVVTVTPTGYFAEDYSLLDELKPHNIDIVRVGSFDVNRLFRKRGVVKLPSESTRKLFTYTSDLFFIPDNKIGWKKRVLREMKSLLKEKTFNIIFATAPPFTDFLIGRDLRKQYQIPLVIDYRDAWLEYPYKYYPTRLHKFLNYRLEKDVLLSASAIITTNRRVKELLITRHKFLNYNDVKILSQGYDPADFAESMQVKKQEKKFQIAHAGTFYADRTPQHFLQAVKRAIAEHPPLAEKLEVHFIGAFRAIDKRLITSLGLDTLVHIHGYLDHRACVRELMASDVLWLTLGNDKQSPGKVYEYLGARKPILACIPDGFIRQTLAEAGAAVIVQPDDVKGITKALLNFFDQHEKGKLPKPRDEVVERYNRIILTEELAKVFGFLTES